MMRTGRTNIAKASSRHHQLSLSYGKHQNENISERAWSICVIQLWNCSVAKYHHRAVMNFVKERMQPDREKSIFDLIKRSSNKTFASSNKSLKLKAHNKVIELKETCNLFAWCAFVKDERNIEMKTVTGEHELTDVLLSLFNPDRSLINGGPGK